METNEILEQFERDTGRFARAAVEEAVARQQEITPDLLHILESTVTSAIEGGAEDDSMAHIYAMFLLAQFREPRAYPLVVQLALLDGDLLHSLCGDFITQGLGRVLASVCGGDWGDIQSIIENENADEWARSAALDAITTLVSEGHQSREAAIDYFAQLFRSKLQRRPSEVWNSLVAACCDLYPEERLDDIRQAYREGLVDPGNISIQDVQRDLALGKDRVLARLADDRHNRFIRNTINEMEWWACFRDGERGFAFNLNNPVPTIVSERKAPPKIGRNDPCPCGSGKKYKKCCGK